MAQFFARLALNLALKLGPVSIVNGLKGLQYVGLFVVALVLSRWLPRLLSEELSGQSLRQKLVGIAVIGAGLFLVTVSIV